MNVPSRVVFCICVALVSCAKEPELHETSQEEFSKNIRTTNARSPQEELAGFKVPKGFKIELFASEPDIGKPLNMAFDEKGRMWLTQSNEYPFPNKAGKDRITILEDTDHDGSADRFIEFADSLNIPIGILPVENGAIAYSIPYVYHLIDHDGDDKVDERKVLLSGFEYSDTHGMVNNFIRGLDGWIHADHGYKNKSKVVGANTTDTVYMNSGNTFRFLPDGSRVELTTTGRVNPFGLTYDNYGYLYGVDCHSSPIYQLIRGGDYPHFGKMPTGIGYAPYMMRHDYGSTALAGIELYVAPDFPEAFQNNFYYGDVVLSRVLRSSMTMDGTTPVPQQETDFVISDDPWFRPVDVKLGPDGALYIADFYNRIIGHYEVPLDHPGRDRERGRIWRVTYVGEDSSSDYEAVDWSKADLPALVSGLADKNMVARMIIAEQIVSRYSSEAPAMLQKLIREKGASSEQIRHSLWILYRLNALPEDLIVDILRSDDEISMVHALHILFEYDALDQELFELIREMAGHQSPHVRRASTMVLSKYPSKKNVEDLMEALETVDDKDSHLKYTIRQSLRDQLRDSDVLLAINDETWSEDHSRHLADVLVGVNDPIAGKFLLEHLEKYKEPVAQTIAYSKHSARFLPMNDLDRLLDFCQQVASDSLDLQYTLFTSIQEGVGQRGESMTQKGITWATDLAGRFLTISPGSWRPLPHGDLPYTHNPWITVSFPEDNEALTYLSTITEGIHTGTIHSPVFSIPSRLSFTLIGHKSEPLLNEEPTPSRLKIQLRHAANDEIIREVLVMEPSERRTVEWTFNAEKGESGYLAIEDGSAAKGEYIGIGGINVNLEEFPEDLNQLTRRQLFGCSVARDYNVRSLAAPLKKILGSTTADINVKGKALEALLSINPSEGLELAGNMISDENTSEPMVKRIVASLQGMPGAEAQEVLVFAAKRVDYVGKKEIALSLANTTAGIDLLFKSAKTLDIPPSMLLDQKVEAKLSSTMSSSQENQLIQLVSGVKAPDEEIQMLLDERISQFNSSKYQINDGMRVFNQNCIACHQVKEQGGNIGPQLDGIGNWGHEALMEKILDPNRSISQAFINYTITMKDGSIKTGLFRREEGNLLVFADPAGNEFIIPKSSIADRKATPFSLMPDQFSKTISTEDFNALITYLLSLK